MNDSQVEIILLNTCRDLCKKGIDLFKRQGTESYVERCAIFDAAKKIYELTDKSEIDSFESWSANIQ